MSLPRLWGRANRPLETARRIPTRSSTNGTGSYLLVLHLRTGTRMTVGSLGERDFLPGYYVYCGSALGGFRPRLLRHASRKKTPRWHIDYLTNKASIAEIVIFESRDRLECVLARVLIDEATPVDRFGCSDCDCSTHLFFAPRERDMAAAVDKVLDAVEAQSTVLMRRDLPRYPGLNRH